jgi:hypothetical protein
VTPRPRPSAAAAVALVATAAAALLLGGCGSGGGSAEPRSAGTSAPAASAPGTATAPAPAPPGTPSASGSASEAPGSAADAPKVPDAQLTAPGGGHFTAPQKKYLSGRVPRGTDPVAVLEGGQEICDRLARTAAVDEGAAASALVTGDISLDGAAAATRTLCPAQQGVVDAARHGFGDGTFAVAAKAVPGKAVAPGRYRAPHPSPSCTWRVTDAHGGTLSSGAAGQPALTLPAAARGVTSTGCYAWLADERP